LSESEKFSQIIGDGNKIFFKEGKEENEKIRINFFFKNINISLDLIKKEELSIK